MSELVKDSQAWQAKRTYLRSLVEQDRRENWQSAAPSVNVAITEMAQRELYDLVAKLGARLEALEKRGK